MTERVSLILKHDEIILPVVINSKKFRLKNVVVYFVVDTGSGDSFLSVKDVKRLQINQSSLKKEEPIRFGGGTFETYFLQNIEVTVLNDTSSKKRYRKNKVTLLTLKTRRISEEKKGIAEGLPSILGLTFLKKYKYSLHVVPTENMAYLQYEG